MKAAVWYGKEDVRIEEYPEPSVGKGEVKLKIKACGICGSDLHEYKDGPFIIPSRPHPLTGRSLGPVVIGHEFAGEVVEVGEGVTKTKIGDRVTINPLVYCGECYYCKQGLHIMCLKLGTAGFACDGGFAEYGVFPEYGVHKLPDKVTDDMGCFVEPLAVALHAINRSRMKVGDTVVVIGAGPIGLLVMQCALAAGAKQVFVSEPMQARRELAVKLGATAVFDPTQCDVGKEIGKHTDNLKANIVFECVGLPATFDTAIKVSSRRGIICVVGLALKPQEVNFMRLWGQEKEIVFSSGYNDEFATCIAYLADGRVKIDSLITARIGLDDYVQKGVKELISRGDQQIKILVTM
jgi:(R,R)-butanediol dehydrogenase/meso-butanediol dehydrogenase/diacetyl reductase